MAGRPNDGRLWAVSEVTKDLSNDDFIGLR